MGPRLIEKLKFQAWHRGTRENDLLLGPYAQARLPHFSQDQIHIFQQLLDESDLDIFDWIVHKVKSPLIYQKLIGDITKYHEHF